MNFMLRKLLLNLVHVLFFENPRKFCAKVEDRELDLLGLISDDLQSDDNDQIVSFDTKTNTPKPAIPIAIVPAEIEPKKIVDIQTIEIVPSIEKETPIETTEIVVVVKTNNQAIDIVPAEIEPVKQNETVLSNEIVPVQNNELVSVPATAEKSFAVIDALAFFELTSSKLTEDKVRNVFRKMVLDYHPDRNASTTTDLMQKIYDSKDILLNEVRNVTATATATATAVLRITVPVVHSEDILEYSMNLQKKELRKFHSATTVITRKRDLSDDTDTCYEPPKKRRKRNPVPTNEEIDAICNQLSNSYITEPVEQLSKSLEKLIISKKSAKVTKEQATKEEQQQQEQPVPMELHDPMDWEEWTPEDTEMGGESAHLKRGGVYLLFEQPCFKKRRRFEREEMNWQSS